MLHRKSSSSFLDGLLTLSSNALTPRLSRRIVLLGALGLAGCGLTPVYGPSGGGTALRGAIAFETPQTVAEYQLRNRLIARLGDTVEPRYSLRVSLTETPTPATITLGGDTTRFNLVGTAHWVLSDHLGTTVKSGLEETFMSYSATGSTVATQAAAKDASARLSVALADLIVARLLLSAAELAQ